jgi:tyrosinase
MVAVYERALRDECGLTTAHPYVSSSGHFSLSLTIIFLSYWDWTLDTHSSAQFTQSPVFDATFGFGGNGPYLPSPPGSPPGFEVPGRTGGGCVANGPFSTMVVRMGPADDMTGNPRCLHRDLSPTFATQFLNEGITEDTISKSDYGHFMRAVEGETNFEHSGIHGGGHYGVGGTLGEMGDLFNSPSGMFTLNFYDPFFPHAFFRSAILYAPREPRSCLVVVAEEEPSRSPYGYFWAHQHPRL